MTLNFTRSQVVFSAAVFAGAALPGANAGAPTVAKAGAPAIVATTRRAAVPASIGCSKNNTVVIIPVPGDALIKAINNDNCNVIHSVDCEGLTASEAFKKATTCGDKGKNTGYLYHLARDGNFNAEYRLDTSIHTTEKLEETPSPSPQPDSPRQIVAECKDGEASLVVTSKAWSDHIQDRQQCDLVNPTCYKNGDIAEDPKQVASDALSCEGNDGLLNHLRKQNINAEIIENPPAPTPASPPASPTADNESPTPSPAPPTQVTADQTPASSPPSSPVSSGNEITSEEKNSANDETSTSISPLTDDQIARTLGLDDENYTRDEKNKLVALAKTKIKHCSQINAIEFLAALRLQKNIDGFSDFFSGGHQDLEQGFLNIKCNLRRADSDSLNIDSGFKEMLGVARRVNEGSIKGMVTIVGGTCALAVMGVLMRCLHNRRGSATVTGSSRTTQVGGQLGYPREEAAIDVPV